MSDESTNEPDAEAEYRGPLRRIRLIARIIFGAVAVFAIVSFAAGLVHIAAGAWKELSGGGK